MYVRDFGHRRPYGGLQCPLGRPVGLPAWPPVSLAWPTGLAWASVLPFLACRTPVGRLLDAKWTPNGRQLSAKLDCQNGCQCQCATSERHNACQVRQNALPTVLLSPDGDICSTSISMFVQIINNDISICGVSILVYNMYKYRKLLCSTPLYSTLTHSALLRAT